MIGVTLGSYRVTKRLSAGGMGEVYIAEHTLIGRKAAIKLLLPEVSQKSEIVDRFFNEAKATAAIGHPGIVEIFDFGFHSDGRAYLVMEFLNGETVNARLKRDGKQAVGSCLAIMEYMTSALGAAHKKGIVHRDLKPDNVFLVEDPGVRFGLRPKLLDFGIAKLQDNPGGASKTRTGLIMGTPAYMAPEQCRGAGEVDHRADLYSLGCIFFALLCGRPPFVGTGAGELIGMQQFMEPPTPRSIDSTIHPAVDEVVMRLLRKNPDERMSSTDELAVELADLVELLGAYGGGRASSQMPAQPPRRPSTPLPGMPPRAATADPDFPRHPFTPPPPAPPRPATGDFARQPHTPPPPAPRASSSAEFATRPLTPVPQGHQPHLAETESMPKLDLDSLQALSRGSRGGGRSPTPPLGQPSLSGGVPRRSPSAPPDTLTPGPSRRPSSPGISQPTTLGGAASESIAPSDPGPSPWRRWIAIAGAAVVVLGAGLGFMLMGGSDDEPAAAAVTESPEDGEASAEEVAPDVAPGEQDSPAADEAQAAAEVEDTDAEAVADDSAGEGAGEDELEFAVADVSEAVAEAVDEDVELTIDSEPPGAAVRLSGSDEVLGETPYTHPARRDSGRLTFTLELDGYAKRRVRFATDEDGRRRVRLKQRSQRSDGDDKGGKKKGGKGHKIEDTKDPFTDIR